MSDIIIAILHFPNDPTNNNAAHQMYIAEMTLSYMELYSVSSILGKEKRVYGKDKDNYLTILPPEDRDNGFKFPSFIDCTKMYKIDIRNISNLEVLSQRNLDEALVLKIKNKISEMKSKGKHVIYKISEEEFRAWNPKLK